MSLSFTGTPAGIAGSPFQMTTSRRTGTPDKKISCRGYMFCSTHSVAGTFLSRIPFLAFKTDGWKTPDRAKTTRKRHVEGMVQLPLFDFEPREKAVGAEEGSGPTRKKIPLHLGGEPDMGLDTEK
jgi:hypothetical protein